MAKAQIIKEDSLKRLKNYLLENIERLDAERIVLEAETNQEQSHHRNQSVLDSQNLRLRDCYSEREVYHSCLCAIQRNITEIEI